MSYLEGCTAPMRDENQLHAAVVELVALGDAEIKNTLPFKTGTQVTLKDEAGFTILSRREAYVPGRKSKKFLTQIETGSAITWKYPSVILKGDESVGEFYSQLSRLSSSRLTPAQK